MDDVRTQYEWLFIAGCLIGMGRNTYPPIRYYHDTWVPIQYVLQFF